jgi:hypothetical protein
MEQAPVRLPTVREVMRSFQENKRLIQLIQRMAREMERLDEDNRQLRAAVSLYREVERKRGCCEDRDRNQTAVPIQIPRAMAARASAAGRRRAAVRPDHLTMSAMQAPYEESKD